MEIGSLHSAAGGHEQQCHTLACRVLLTANPLDHQSVVHIQTPVTQHQTEYCVSRFQRCSVWYNNWLQLRPQYD